MITRNMLERGKRGQATIFIIIALIIVAVVFVIFIYPKIKGGSQIDVTQDPQIYLESCLKSNLKDNINKLSIHGGDFNPEGYVQFNGTKIKYLCYTNEYYKTCVNQQPMIKEHFEDVLTEAMKGNVASCVKNLQNEYEKRGWKISAGDVSSDVNLITDAIIININAPMTLTNEVSKTYRTFEIRYPSKMYEILYLASSIVSYESTFGDSETFTYLLFYPNVNIYKNHLGDGTVIYRVENVITKEGFTFASRSLAWPPGLGPQ